MLTTDFVYFFDAESTSIVQPNTFNSVQASPAGAAETARGRAAGFHKNQTTLEVETKSKVTVIELVAGVKD